MAKSDKQENLLSSTLLVGSECYFDLFCQPCSEDNKHVEAKGFCQNCCEYLCQDCYSSHRKPKPSRHHVLLDESKMPKTKPMTATGETCTDICDQHKEKFVKYYCPDHDQLGCSICMTISHRVCDGVKYIPDIAEGIQDSREYRVLENNVQDTTRLAKGIIGKSKENISKSETCFASAKEAVYQLRKGIIERLDVLEKSVLEQADKHKSESIKKMKLTTDECTNALQEIQALESNMQILKQSKKHSQLFTAVKRASKKIPILNDRLRVQEKNNSVTLYKFHRSDQIWDVLSNQESFGCMSTESFLTKDPGDLKAVHLTDINIKTDGESFRKVITGAAILPDGKLVIADCYNKKLKVIDTKNNVMVSELMTSCLPWDVTKVSRRQVATTLPSENKIMCLKLDSTDTLKLEREISVNGICYGIVYNRDRFIVTFQDSENKLEILDHDGIVLQSFAKNALGQDLFTSIPYVGVSIDQQLLISEYRSNTVVGLSLNGELKIFYEDVDLKSPTKLAIDENGTVYIGGFDSVNVHQVTKDGKKIQILLSSKDGLKGTQSISYCRETGRLYVGMEERNIIKVFQLI